MKQHCTPPLSQKKHLSPVSLSSSFFIDILIAFIHRLFFCLSHFSLSRTAAYRHRVGRFFIDVWLAVVRRVFTEPRLWFTAFEIHSPVISLASEHLNPAASAFVFLEELCGLTRLLQDKSLHSVAEADGRLYSLRKCYCSAVARVLLRRLVLSYIFGLLGEENESVMGLSDSSHTVWE